MESFFDLTNKVRELGVEGISVLEEKEDRQSLFHIRPALCLSLLMGFTVFGVHGDTAIMLCKGDKTGKRERSNNGRLKRGSNFVFAKQPVGTEEVYSERMLTILNVGHAAVK